MMDLTGTARALSNALGFEQSSDRAVGDLLTALACTVPPAGRILELGTGAGVGTAALVKGLGDRRDVEVVTIERDEDLAAKAAELPWPGFVSLVVGDALEHLPTCGSFDLVFADSTAGKWHGLELTLAAVREGGVLVLDHMEPEHWVDDEHRERTRQVRSAVLGHADFHAAELHCATGVVLATRAKTGDAAAMEAIRPARPSDAGRLLPIMRELGETHDSPDALSAALRTTSLRTDSEVLVAEVGGEVVGFVYVHAIATVLRPGTWARLASMAVAGAHRRRGIGSELLAAAEAVARVMGAESIELTSGVQRTGAHAFYRHHGYDLTTNSTWLAKAL